MSCPWLRYGPRSGARVASLRRPILRSKLCFEEMHPLPQPGKIVVVKEHIDQEGLRCDSRVS